MASFQLPVHPQVGNSQPHCLFASEAEGRCHANEMNLRKWENPGSSLEHTGWIARRIPLPPPVEGEVFFLTSPPETPSSLCWCDLEAQFGCFLSEELDLLSAISVLVVLGAFVNVVLTVLQHSIDQSGEPVGRGRNGFRSPELGA